MRKGFTNKAPHILLAQCFFELGNSIIGATMAADPGPSCDTEHSCSQDAHSNHWKKIGLYLGS